MSEYQAYQFDRINRTLTPAERKAVSSLSSHISVRGSSAFVHYYYGDFKHDPVKVLTQYFDMFTYCANWGSQLIGFRFDEAAVDYEALTAYAVEDIISIHRKDGNVLIVTDYCENYSDVDYPSSYDEDDAFSGGFTNFYTEILEGDYRSLFLLWLKACALNDEDSASAPLAPGMKNLSQAHEELIDFIGLDQDLIHLAAQGSPPLQKTELTNADTAALLGNLDNQTQQNYLAKFLQKEPLTVRAELIRHLRQFNPSKQPKISHQLVSCALLLQGVESLKLEREAKEATKREAAQQAYLNELKQRAAEMWTKAAELIERKKTKDYENAARILQALKYLAAHEDTLPKFYSQSDAIIDGYPTLKGMRARMAYAEVFSKSLEDNSVRATILKANWQKQNPLDQRFNFHLLDA